MAAPMTYDFILRNKMNPQDKLMYPLNGWETICFYRLAGKLDDLTEEAGEWMKGKVPVLDSLEYWFDEENTDIHCVQKIMEMLFDNCQYNVQWEVTKHEELVNGNNCRMFLTNLDDMPRGLFMNKMFCVRNLIRDHESTKAFNALLSGGVPFNIAAYLGGGLEFKLDWQGNPYATIKDYAGYLEQTAPHFAEMIRSMSSNSYGEQTSLPWKEGWGYNYQEGRFWEDPLPQEICGAVRGFKEGDHFPEGWEKGDMWEMSADKLTTLVRFICKDDKINIQFEI